MRNLFYLVVISSVLLSCVTSNGKNKSQVIKGDLYYSWIKITNFYNQPDSIYEKVVANKDSFVTNLKKNDELLYNRFKVIDENKLYFTPYIYLKSGNSKSIYKTVFMDSSMYVAFTKFNYKDLIKNKEKVKIKLKAIQLDSTNFKAEEIIEIKVVSGQTLEHSRKLKYENYR